MVGASRSRGFNLVALVVFTAVLAIVVAAALPLWSQAAQREKEEELIFRGLQYAEAIRVFQQRTGRYPVRLEELLEVHPRSIRQLWKDPMAEHGTLDRTGPGVKSADWGVIYAQAAGAGQPGASLSPDGRGPSPRGRDEDEDDSEERARPRRRGRGQPDELKVGPIVGVHSRVKDKAIKSFAGGSRYNEWIFTPDMLPTLPGPLTGDNVPRLNARWVGRPLPAGVEPEQGSGLEAADDDDKQEPTRSRRGRRRDSRGRGGSGGG